MSSVSISSERVAGADLDGLIKRVEHDESQRGEFYAAVRVGPDDTGELLQAELSSVTQQLAEQRQGAQQALMGGETIDPIAELAQHLRVLCGPDEDGMQKLDLANVRVILRNAVDHAESFFDEEWYAGHRDRLARFLCQISVLGPRVVLELSMDLPDPDKRSLPGTLRPGTEKFGLRLDPALYERVAAAREAASRQTA